MNEKASMSPEELKDSAESSTQDVSIGLWNDHASWWQEEFTDGVDPEYTEQILPLIVERLQTATKVLDVGAGEGQVTRHLLESGVLSVTALDPIADQVELAHTRSGGNGDFIRAAADRLPFANSSFDAVVACLVFEHIDAVDEAISEVARVLEPGGRFLFLLNHPLLQTPNSGWIDDQFVDPPEQYWRVGNYLDEQETVEEVTKNVFIRFVHRPLSRYVNALFDAGLSIEHMDEPAPPPGYVAQSFAYGNAASIPRLLALTCRLGDAA